MVCKVCGSDCNYESTGSSFSIYVGEDSKHAAVVPCNKRVWFNDMTGEELTFEANEHTYTVKCHKGSNQSGKGQRVIFFLGQPSPRAVVTYVQFGNDWEHDQMQEQVDVIEVSDGDDENEEDTDGDDEVIMHTRGVELNEQEISKLQLLLPLNNGFIGAPFVHRLTRTNIDLGCMKIPKEVVVALPFKEQGHVGICLDGGRFRKIPYKTAVDGRIALGKNKWKDFAASRDLTASTAVPMAFQHIPDNNLDVLINIKKLG